MAIVTLSYEIGSGGAEIGAALAERLGYRRVDHDMITQAAYYYGVGEKKLTRLDETKPSLFERFDVETRRYMTVLQSALLDVAERDNVVIIGRGGQMLLRGIAHVLRVRVTAPFDVRVERAMQKMGGRIAETADILTTSEMVRRSDHEKYGRIRYLYDVDWADPALYDIVISTDKLASQAVVEVILGLLRRPELAPTEASYQAVRDRALASRVRTALSAHPETRKYRINVEADRGIIQLEGTAPLDRATEVARSVAGVIEVKCQLLEAPPFVA